MLNSLDGIMLKHDDKVSLVGDLLSNTGCKKKPLFSWFLLRFSLSRYGISERAIERNYTY